MATILWIIFGALVGWIASMVMKTDSERGLLFNSIAGIVGSVIGGWLMSILGRGNPPGTFNVSSFFIAVLGACTVIALMRAAQRA